MSLKSCIISAPLPYDRDRATETLALFDGLSKPQSNLIAGIAGCSPYLRSLIEKENQWLTGVWGQNPEVIFTQILDNIETSGFDVISRSLRKAKRRVALLTGLCDLGGVWTLEQVTTSLTEFADRAVQTALRGLLELEIDRGKLAGCTKDDLADCAGMVVLAMGKMGAFELNYSSDIDLIVLFDESRHADTDFHEVRASFVRITKRMTKLLSEVTAEGYVFRTDLRLRPDPSVTPVCLSMEAAERYYESLGRTWERAAFIKARPCAGAIAAGERFLEHIRPFIWRKHLDFAAIQDAHDMRLRIRAHKGLGGPIEVAGHNIKLGRGGIREIEFFTQTRQLIAGGRDPDLRSRQTVEGLTALAAKGWIPVEAAEELVSAYRAHRGIEHRLQMIQDAQTHLLPLASDQLARLANFSSAASVSAFCDDLEKRLNRVHLLTEGFFKPGKKPNQTEGGIIGEDIFAAWHHLPALRSPRAVEIFDRLKPLMMQRLKAALSPEEALAQLDKFFKGLPAGVQLFALFESNPQILDLLVDICATSPNLASYLSKNSQVFDAVIAGSFFEPLPGAKELSKELEQQLVQLADYEDVLNQIRRWQKEKHFRIGVLQLRGFADAKEAAQAYSNLAETCVKALFPRVAANFARRHGPMPGRGAGVLAMGKLGSAEMTAHSDLDLIVIYDAGGATASEGAKPLAITAYYARFTQGLITALTSAMAQGKLYEVDMRLRPSGRQGPVAASLQSFEDYQRTEAWTWEHLALTRGRMIAGDTALAKEVTEVRSKILALRRRRSATLQDVAKMRQRIAENKGAGAGIWDVKNCTGGLQDIELFAQTTALLGGCTAYDPISQLLAAAASREITEDVANELAKTYALLAQVQHIQRLIVLGRFTIEMLGKGGTALMLKATGFTALEDLEQAISKKTVFAAAAFSHYLQIDAEANKGRSDG